MNVGIVGLGLIGGSMAKSVKKRTLHSVWGLDKESETMTFARICGAMDAPLTQENLEQVDLLMLAIRPEACIRWVQENAHRLKKSALVVDLCGVKRDVVAALSPVAAEHGFSYIGGHPMAGSERSGFTASSEDLYLGASMILTPDENAGIGTLEQLKSFFLDAGFGSVVFSTPEEHDRIIAYTSQLAHISSSAFVKSPTAQQRRGFSAGSFADMTRVARLDENMWTELFAHDADYLTEELRFFIASLQKYLDALEQKDFEQIRALLKEGREKKAAAGGN